MFSELLTTEEKASVSLMTHDVFIGDKHTHWLKDSCTSADHWNYSCDNKNHAFVIYYQMSAILDRGNVSCSSFPIVSVR